MAAFLKKYKATVGAAPGGQTYFFLQNANSYGGSIDTATGVQVAGDNEQDMPVTSVSELLRTQTLIRVNVRYTSGAGTKTAKLLVTRSKIATALDELVDKSFRGGTIKTVSIPTKATYR